MRLNVRSVLFVVIIIVCGASPLHAQATVRASVSSAGAQGNGFSDGSALSLRGRYVAFSSGSTNLIPVDVNGNYRDIFLHDLETSATELISISSSGIQSDSNSYDPSLTPDGRYVAFLSTATNLVPNDTNNLADVFIRDRYTGTTERASLSSTGQEPNAYCIGPPGISADGRFVVFYGGATNLVLDDTNNDYDVFLRDRILGTTERMNLSSSGDQANQSASLPTISSDGRFVAFQSTATNLAPVGNTGHQNIFVRDRATNTTFATSVSTTGGPSNGDSGNPSLSLDGRYVAFDSTATNFVATPTLGISQVFVRDTSMNTTQLISVSSAGAVGNDGSFAARISADGRYVAFTSAATNLAPNDTNGVFDVFVHDRLTGTTELASVNSSGIEGNAQSRFPAISTAGDEVAFISDATNLVPSDTGIDDVFVRDRHASHAAGFCEPDGASLICPCGNPSTTPHSGCNNSSGTGGASIVASGIAYLSMDSLVLTTSGEPPTATSIVLQGRAAGVQGVALGQGLSCVTGHLVRLYLKQASSGSITAPELMLGDPSVSTQSTALGDPIAPGEYRFDFIYYRDPLVLGGCASSSTYNTSAGARILWFP